MGRVRRADPPAHVCAPPTVDVRLTVPSLSMTPGVAAAEWTDRQVDGRPGDLWRCWCGALWRVGDACDSCDRGRTAHGGMHAMGLCWRPARWWQRIAYRGGA